MPRRGEDASEVPGKRVQSKQTPEDVAKIVLTRHLAELNGTWSAGPEWQIQTLMYRSGPVFHEPGRGSQELEPSPELLDSPTLEQRPVDNMHLVRSQTGRQLQCINGVQAQTFRTEKRLLGSDAPRLHPQQAVLQQ